jgi:hypothetical protein
MPTLLDPAFRDDVKRRLRALTPTSQRRWGKMSVDQMLWHLSAATELTMGKSKLAWSPPPIPGAVIRFVALQLPWWKGMPTAPSFVARSQYDFETERGRLLRAIDELVAVAEAGKLPRHPAFKTDSAEWLMALQGKHFEHHLQQFGA